MEVTINYMCNLDTSKAAIQIIIENSNEEEMVIFEQFPESLKNGDKVLKVITEDGVHLTLSKGPP